jgi:type VI secretion system protein VasI
MVNALVMVMLLVQAPAATDEERDQERMAKMVQRCLELTGSTERLECYDRATRGLTTPAAKPEAAGKWEISRKTDPLDDSKIYIGVLPAIEKTGALLLRCKGGTTEAFIGWMSYLGQDAASVTTRIDAGTAETKNWSISPEGRAAFYPGGESADRQFIERLAEAGKLVAQVTPYSSSPVTATFDLAGIKDVVGGLSETCAWPKR